MDSRLLARCAAPSTHLICQLLLSSHSLNLHLPPSFLFFLGFWVSGRISSAARIHPQETFKALVEQPLAKEAALAGAHGTLDVHAHFLYALDNTGTRALRNAKQGQGAVDGALAAQQQGRP